MDLEGAGWEYYQVPAIPWTVQGVVGGLISFDDAEVGNPFEMRMTVRQGQLEIGSRAAFVVTPSGTLTPFVVPFTGIVREHSDLEVWLEHADEPLASTSCRINLNRR